MNFIDGATLILFGYILQKNNMDSVKQSHINLNLSQRHCGYLLVNAKLCNELCKQIIQGTLVLFILTIQVRGQHEDNLHVRDGLDSSYIVEL